MDFCLKPLQQPRLSNKVLGLFAKSVFDDRPQDFLPESCLDDLVTRDSVEKELDLTSSSSDAFVDAVIQWIPETARRVFSILTQVNMSKEEMKNAMMICYVKEFNDTCLPIGNPRNADFTMHAALQFPNIWTELRLYSFYEAQWKFLAPVFTLDKYNYDLDSEQILPMIWKDAKDTKSGAFSSVVPMKIHPAHLKLDLYKVGSHTN
jgi:hypothetical protein